ncbi:hypothetical protein ACODNH_05450 [Haloarcula sp. NS06]|uniref:hypothetical protein n=1 Tax=Haloarcula sp. NS06 TaxID=3409688 RepID=UPI003DA72EE3
MAIAATADITALAQLDDRDIKALTEPMDIYADDPACRKEQVAVYNHGDRYIVTPDVPCCDCPDMLHRRPSGGCKHIRRIEFERGERPIPVGVNDDAIDDGLHIDSGVGR